MSFYEIIGWTGAASYILAYLLLSVNVFTGQSVRYHVMNAIGGICLTAHAVQLQDNPNVVTNLIWFAIAFYAVLKIVRYRLRTGNTKKL